MAVEISLVDAQALPGSVELRWYSPGGAGVVAGGYAAWEAERNERQVGVDWRFTTADARIKLKRLYPAPRMC